MVLVWRQRGVGREEQKKTAGPGGEVSWWGSGLEDLGLAQPGASLADAAADWMRGPPLTDCWRRELCVPGRPKPPLCLADCLSTPPSLYLSFPLSPALPPSPPFHCNHQRLQLHLLHTNPHAHTHRKNMPDADTHKKTELCAQCARKLSASNVPKQMAETNFSLFADSCATSCNKKSMNQGQSIYSNNKDREICHFPTLPFFFSFFFDENMPFFFSRRTAGWGWWGLGWESPTCTHKQSAQSHKIKKEREREIWGKNACTPQHPHQTQPEEKASDCDKPNTLCNRIFHLCKTDKEEKT